LKPEWLPINSPELNDVDRIFSLIQREVLNNRHFSSIEEVKSAIDKWMRKFNSNEIAISLQN
jgi:transposase